MDQFNQGEISPLILFFKFFVQNVLLIETKNKNRYIFRKLCAFVYRHLPE